MAVRTWRWSAPPSRAWRGASPTSRGAARYVRDLAPGDRLVEGSIGLPGTRQWPARIVKKWIFRPRPRDPIVGLMGRQYPYVTVDVFTDRPFTGNPLAVIPNATGLTPAEMQAIAGEFNYSESTFGLPPGDPAHTARVRIFTRRNEIPFAGHPNIGTAFAIAHAAERSGAALGPTLLFEEGAGLVPVDVLREIDGRVVGATLTAPKPLTVGMTIPSAVVARCIGLEPTAVRTSTHDPVVASIGLPFVIAEVARDLSSSAQPAASA